jgi:hypothetical protein
MLEQISTFNYLECYIFYNGSNDVEIKLHRIQQILDTTKQTILRKVIKILFSHFIKQWLSQHLHSVLSMGDNC